MRFGSSGQNASRTEPSALTGSRGLIGGVPSPSAAREHPSGAVSSLAAAVSPALPIRQHLHPRSKTAKAGWNIGSSSRRTHFPPQSGHRNGNPWDPLQSHSRCTRAWLPCQYGNLCEARPRLSVSSCDALAGRCKVNVPDLLLLVECYVGLRCAIGYSVRYEEKLLKDFVQFLASQNVSGPIRAQRAIDWACAPAPGRGPSGQASRLKVVRGFLTYLRATLPETETPGSGGLAPIRRPSPYLYSQGEIETLMYEALRL